MRYFLFLIVILFSISLQAANPDRIHGIELNTTEEVKEWCKNKSLEYFIDKKKTPDNWIASSWIEVNIINIKGSWVADNIEYTVKCRVKKGLKERNAVITIDEKKHNKK